MNDPDLNLRFSTHEAVCAERWTETISRIKRLEVIMASGAAGVIGLLCTIAFKIN